MELQSKYCGVIVINGVDTPVETDIPLDYLRFMYQSPPVAVISKPRKLELKTNNRQPVANESQIIRRFTPSAERGKKVFDLTAVDTGFSFTSTRQVRKSFDMTG